MTEEATHDLDVLFPDREIPIGGKTVTVREYSFEEELKLTPIARPLIQALADHCSADKEMGYEQALDVIGEHYEIFMQLVSAACDQSLEWVKQAGRKNGARLGVMVWEVNQDFFSERLLAEMMSRQQTKMHSHGATSSTS